MAEHLVAPKVALKGGPMAVSMAGPLVGSKVERKDAQTVDSRVAMTVGRKDERSVGSRAATKADWMVGSKAVSTADYWAGQMVHCSVERLVALRVALMVCQKAVKKAAL